MAIMEVIQEPNPLLRVTSQPVKKFDVGFKAFMQNLLETMYHENGIGIAAIQVGKPMRALIVDIPQGEKREPFFIINPVITSLSAEKVILDEGCLSVKNAELLTKGEVERPISINIRYQDLNGLYKELSVNGKNSDYHLWFARCLQHELDHLDGVLFIDKLYMPDNITANTLNINSKSTCVK